jgi:hypothetical protein
MSLAANKSLLLGASKELSLQWQQTKDTWKDSKSREFELQYLEELMTNVDKSLEIIENLDKLLTKIRNDCE